MDDRIEQEMIALLPRLRRFAYSLTGSWPDADDLAQATCVRAIDRLEQWELGTRLDSWMYRIAQNLHRNELRAGRVRAAHLREVDADAVDAIAASRPIDQLALGELDRALARLPAEQRAVLLLVTVEGQTYQEVAAVMGISPGTVASRIARARASLSAMMEDEQ